MPSDRMRKALVWKRMLADRAATLGALVAALLVIAPLIAIFAYLVIRGVSALNLSFLTNAPSRSARPAEAWATRSWGRP